MCAFTPLSEHTETIRPQPAARMCGNAACIAQNALISPTRKECSRASSVLYSRRATPPPPQALFTRMSVLPNSLTAHSTAAITWSRTPTPPGASSAPARPVSSTSSATSTFAPSRAKRRAIARPIPCPAPVTIAARPFSLCISAPPRQPALAEPLLEHRDPVVPPERLAVHDEQRHTEYVIGVRLLDAGLELLRAVSGQEFVIGVGIVTELADQCGHLRGLLD